MSAEEIDAVPEPSIPLNQVSQLALRAGEVLEELAEVVAKMAEILKGGNGVS